MVELEFPYVDYIHKCVVFLEWGKGDSKIIDCKGVSNGFFLMAELESICRWDSQMCGFLRMEERGFENNLL